MAGNGKMNSSRYLIGLLLAAGGFFGCKLGTQPSTVSHRTNYKYIIPSEVAFTRLGDGNSVQIQFSTREDSLCELFYYSQDPSGLPSEDAPVRSPCSGGDTPRTEFNETLTGLNAETVYNFGIFVWTVASTKEKGEVLLVRESTGESGAVRNRDGEYEEIMLARFNAPLRTAEVQKARLDPPLPASAIIGRSRSNLGCGPALDELAWTSRSANGRDGLSSLAMRGFATGEAAEKDSRLIAVFNALQFGNPEWEWTYRTPARENILVKIRPPARLTAVEVSQRTRTTLPEVKLSDAEASIPLDSGYPLTIAWQWENLPANAFLHLRIGKAGETGSLLCTFDPKAGRASVEPAFFNGLPPGKQSLVLELESLVFHATTGWFVRSIDWRSIKLEKS